MHAIPYQYLQHYGALIVAQGNEIGSLEIGYGPNTFHAVVEGLLQAIRVGVPDPHGTIFRTTDDDR